MKHTFTFGGEAYTIELSRTTDGYVVRHGERTYDVVVAEMEQGRLRLIVDGGNVSLHAAVNREAHWVAFNGHTYELRQEKQGRKRGQPGADSPEGVLRAPMPGQVRAVKTAVGEEVNKGQALLVLEAMKMEIRIQSPCDGTVVSLPVSEGEQVEKDQVLVEVV